MEEMSIPRCDEAKEFMRRLVSGEARGALGYVVPLANGKVESPRFPGIEREEWLDHPEELLETRLAGLSNRRWGHDHGVPMLSPTSYSGGMIETAFGSRYYYEPVGTVPAIHSADDIGTLPFDATLDDGWIPKALRTVECFAEKVDGRVLIERHHVNGPFSMASLILKNDVLLEALYTHPRDVHRLLDKCTEMFISFVEVQREMVPDLVLANGIHDTYLPPGLGALCEDDLILALSPRMAMEFVIPYFNRIADLYGGLVIHSCGDFTHLFETLRDNVHNLRGIWFNAGECSYERAVEVFRGTDVVLIPRWPLNQKYSFTSRVDFVKRILAGKAPDVSVLLQAHYFGSQSMHDPDVAEEEDQNAIAQDILRVIEKYLATGALD